MKRASRWRPFIYGLIGMALGAVVQTVGPMAIPGFELRDGAMWGAIVGLTIGYLPNFVHIGEQLTRRESAALNVSVGVGAFLGISAVVILVLLLIFWVVGHFLR